MERRQDDAVKRKRLEKGHTCNRVELERFILNIFHPPLFKCQFTLLHSHKQQHSSNRSITNQLELCALYSVKWNFVYQSMILNHFTSVFTVIMRLLYCVSCTGALAFSLYQQHWVIRKLTIALSLCDAPVISVLKRLYLTWNTRVPQITGSRRTVFINKWINLSIKLPALTASSS